MAMVPSQPPRTQRRPRRWISTAGTTLAVLLALLPAVPLFAQATAAHEQFVFAYRLFQRGDIDLATRAFDEYLAQFPKDEKFGDACYFRAEIARRAGRYAEAATYLDKAPAPKHVPENALLLLSGEVRSRLEQYESAVAALEKIDVTKLELPVRASVYYLLGQAYRKLENLPAAAKRLNEASRIESELQARATLELGQVQATMNQPSDAIESLRRAVGMSDAAVAAEAARLAGDLSFGLKNYQPAMDFYNVVLTRYTSSPHVSAAVVGVLWSQYQLKQYGQVIDSFAHHSQSLTGMDRVTGWYLAGSCEQELGRHDRAAQLFAAVLAAAAGSPLEDKVLYRLAASQYEIGQYDAMTQTIAKLRKSYPDSPRLAEAGFLMASAALKQNDTTTAAARLTAIVDAGEAHPYYTQSVLQRAKLYELTNQPAPAAADYQTYVQVYDVAGNQIKLEPATVPQAMLRVVDLDYQLGKYDEAEQWSGRLLEKGGLTPLLEAETLYRRALAQVKLKKFEPARDTFSGLLKKFPENRYRDEARYYRGLVLLTMRKADEALPDLEAAATAQSLAQGLRVNAMRLAALRYRERGEDTKAADWLSQLEKVQGLTGLSAEELLWLGRLRIAEKKAQNALKYLAPLLEGRVAASDTMRGLAMMEAASALRQLGDFGAAINTYREIVAGGLVSGFQARLELGRTLVIANRFDEAHEEYMGLISAHETPVAAAALYDLGKLQRQMALQKVRASDDASAQEHRQEARKALKRLVLLYSFPELTPLPQQALLELADLAQDAGRLDDAKAELNELTTQYPDSAYASYARALLASIDNQRQVAISLLKKLAEDKSVDPDLARRIAERIKALEQPS